MSVQGKKMIKDSNFHIKTNQIFNFDLIPKLSFHEIKRSGKRRINKLNDHFDSTSVLLQPPHIGKVKNELNLGRSLIMKKTGVNAIADENKDRLINFMMRGGSQLRELNERTELTSPVRPSDRPSELEEKNYKNNDKSLRMDNQHGFEIVKINQVSDIKDGIEDKGVKEHNEIKEINDQVEKNFKKVKKLNMEKIDLNPTLKNYYSNFTSNNNNNYNNLLNNIVVNRNLINDYKVLENLSINNLIPNIKPLKSNNLLNSSTDHNNQIEFNTINTPNQYITTSNALTNTNNSNLPFNYLYSHSTKRNHSAHTSQTDSIISSVIF